MFISYGAGQLVLFLSHYPLDETRREITLKRAPTSVSEQQQPARTPTRRLQSMNLTVCRWFVYLCSYKHKESSKTGSTELEGLRTVLIGNESTREKFELKEFIE